MEGERREDYWLSRQRGLIVPDLQAVADATVQKDMVLKFWCTEKQ